MIIQSKGKNIQTSETDNKKRYTNSPMSWLESLCYFPIRNTFREWIVRVCIQTDRTTDRQKIIFRNGSEKITANVTKPISQRLHHVTLRLLYAYWSAKEPEIASRSRKCGGGVGLLLPHPRTSGTDRVGLKKRFAQSRK